MNKAIDKGSSKSILGGSMIIAGTSVGVGIFTLPVASKELWFFPSCFLFILIAYVMYSSGLYFCEVAARMKNPATSIPNMADCVLGKRGYFAANAAVIFICYILIYAYISAGSSILGEVTKSFSDFYIFSDGMNSLLFSLIFSSIVFAGSKAVDKSSVVILFAMIATFVIGISGFIPDLNINNLMQPPAGGYFSFFYAIPFFVVSFGYHTAIPSLLKHYDLNFTKVTRSLFYGVILTLFFYISWIAVSFGFLSYNDLPSLEASGSNAQDVLNLLFSGGGYQAISMFGYFAVISSFLGIGLGLFDFVIDSLKLEAKKFGNIYAALIAFTPSTLLSITYPNGFVSAIGFSAIFASFLLLLLPSLMCLKLRSTTADYKTDGKFFVTGGYPRLLLVLLIGLCSIFFEMYKVFKTI